MHSQTSVVNFKIMSILLVFLNIMDGYLTYVGITSGFMMEANILMLPLVTKLVPLMIIKTIVPAALLLYVYFRMKQTDFKNIRRTNIAVFVILIAYSLINLIHIVSGLYFGFLF